MLGSATGTATLLGAATLTPGTATLALGTATLALGTNAT